MPPSPDLVIIGAGHAGCEAALAAARLGCTALVLGLQLDAVARMSCNPAIGGVAKGQLVREIDALGGAMGQAIDATGIQFRMLNESKGAAVRSPRAQADKEAYARWMKNLLERTEGVRLLQDRAVEIVAEGARVVGVRTALGLEIPCRAVVVATGTFPRGRIHVGRSQSDGGRFGEEAAPEIGGSLAALGLPLLRLKTGTCPRVLARDVDFARMRIQPGDEPPQPFSFRTGRLEVEQVPCHLTWTTEATHRVVRAVLDRSPLFTGQIEGIGPRYCPSFETKLVRFPDRARHHVFVEPEGRSTGELYLSGLSTSIEPEAQAAMVRSVPGLEEAQIVRYGYAVEYDAIASRELRDTLETRAVRGLFCAGQINGTSGYEEAAAQGLYAGANAALYAQNRPPFRLGREEAYLGVLVDDLVTRGTDEPYRLFTSRAEHRLHLRHDNADLRLTAKAREIGLVDEARERPVAELRAEIGQGREVLESGFAGGRPLAQWLKDPECGWPELLAATAGTQAGAALAALSPRAAEQLRIDLRYEGYLRRAETKARRLEKQAPMRIPDDFDYGAVDGLRTEARERLVRVRPGTLGQAARLPGVGPADAALLALKLESRNPPKPRLD